MHLTVLFGTPPSEVVRTLSPADWLLLAAFHDLEPWGPREDDRRAAVAAILPASAMNGHRYDPTALFRSLAADGESPGGQAGVGRSFRFWLAVAAPGRVAVGERQLRASA